MDHPPTKVCAHAPDFSHPMLRYANEAAYPFNILNQTVLATVFWFVVRWPLGVTMKWSIFSMVGGGHARRVRCG